LVGLAVFGAAAAAGAVAAVPEAVAAVPLVVAGAVAVPVMMKR
jgi:hypothetical protein